MDMMIHYGLARKLSADIDANLWIVWTAFILDAVVLSAFMYIKLTSDLLVVIVAIVIVVLLFIMQKLYIGSEKQPDN